MSNSIFYLKDPNSLLKFKYPIFGWVKFNKFYPLMQLLPIPLGI